MLHPFSSTLSRLSCGLHPRSAYNAKNACRNIFSPLHADFPLIHIFALQTGHKNEGPINFLAMYTDVPLVYIHCSAYRAEKMSQSIFMPFMQNFFQLTCSFCQFVLKNGCDIHFFSSVFRFSFSRRRSSA